MIIWLYISETLLTAVEIYSPDCLNGPSTFILNFLILDSVIDIELSLYVSKHLFCIFLNASSIFNQFTLITPTTGINIFPEGETINSKSTIPTRFGSSLKKYFLIISVLIKTDEKITGLYI